MPQIRPSRYSNDYQKLLKLLCAQRQRAGLSQSQIALSMSVSQSMISRLESGAVRMDLIDLLDYIDATDGDPVKFIAQFTSIIGWPKSREPAKK